METSVKTDAEFWDKAWRDGQTAWDMGAVSPALKAYVDQLPDKTIRLLIPGCGNSYEAEYLQKNGFTNVTVVDIAPALTEKLKARLQPENGPVPNVITADFFTLQGSFDVVLEQTFFCALNPELRQPYVEKMHQLLAPGGKLVGVLFNRHFDKAGPPFGGDVAEYEKLFAPYFTIKTMSGCYNSHPARQGNEVFINLIKK